MHMNPSQNQRGRLGLTLIELLVVIAVIAILAGILLPSFHGTKDKAPATACINHLKQVTLAEIVWANDHGHEDSVMSFIAQALRFAVTGILITTFGYVMMVSLTTAFGVGPYAANFLVYTGGLFFSYWVNARLVFRDRTRLKSFMKFLLSFVVAYLANLAILVLGLKVMLLNLWISQLLSIAVYAAVHFTLSRTFVFARSIGWSAMALGRSASKLEDRGH